VDELERDLAAVLVHRARDQLVRQHVAGLVHHAGARVEPRAAVHAEPAGDHEAHAALGALGEVRRQLRVVPEAVLEAGVHGAHDHAVAQRGEAQVQGREQVREGLVHEELRSGWHGVGNLYGV
jgi:hypothetical protein